MLTDQGRICENYYFFFTKANRHFNYFFPYAEEELLTLAKQLRSSTERATKIEVAPWIKDCGVDMEGLYTELTLEKLEDKLHQDQNKPLKDYVELFSDGEEFYSTKTTTQGRRKGHRMGRSPTRCWRNIIQCFRKETDETEDIVIKPGKRFLLKGEPGMGKTTLVKKMAWDWAKKAFTTFYIVFFVFLKSVTPGDPIENVIIQQTPALEGLNVSQQTLEAIFKIFGNRCLLILDGLDENALGQNDDVLKIIKGQKLFHTHVLVTSRPHSTRSLEDYFGTIIRVDGFMESQAEKFAFKILKDQAKVHNVLKFNPADFRQDISLYQCPILLSFMCLLVKEDKTDLLSKETNTGEIYTKMVRCLYIKFTNRAKIEFESCEFTRVITKLGKLALETLFSGNPLLKQSDIIKVDKRAFYYGLLIGHEDCRLLTTDVTGDIVVTFPHRSLQEFLGTFSFIQMLNDGESLESLLGSDCKEPIFMMNPLFLHFCLWFLYSDQKYFSLDNKDQVSDCLVSYCLERLDSVRLDLGKLVISYPAIDIEEAWKKKDWWSLTFFENVLEKGSKFKTVICTSTRLLKWIRDVMKNRRIPVSGLEFVALPN